ncbi:hypothetical protein RIR_jg34432.t1 [Rhizophagus irregularis DAOM 181602=DAOM 197198]|nr:hypothetical protein RIR_jg34432.t1 [Rhizophagus irregularis DAOM 181602=DAOM 197198]
MEVEVMKWNEMEVEERNGSRSDKVEQKEERIVNINKGKKTYTTLKNMYNLLKAKEATTKKIKSRFMFTLFGPIILLASENILSDAVDNAGIGKYLRANILK